MLYVKTIKCPQHMNLFDVLFEYLPDNFSLTLSTGIYHWLEVESKSRFANN